MKDNVQMDASMAKRLLHMIRAAYYMLLKGFCKHKLMLDLHLLLKRGKLAGKAIGDFLTLHHHQHHRHIGARDCSAFSCGPTDPALSFYSSNGVEFSCSNTPDPYPASFFLTSAKRKHHGSRRHHDGYEADVAAAMVRALETLSGETSPSSSPSFYSETAVATPSPAAPAWGLGASPAAVRPLRVTDSPFPVREEGDGGRVDRQAEAFIKRFYEQLRLQQSLPVTPEYCRSRRRKPT